MAEDKELNKAVYSEEDVLQAMAKIEPKYRKWLCNTNFDVLLEAANNYDYWKQVIEEIDKQIDGYTEMKTALCKLCTMVIAMKNGDTIEKRINDMTEVYKGLNREERLEFAKKIAGEKDLGNSVDELKYSFGQFIGELIGEYECPSNDKNV